MVHAELYRNSRTLAGERWREKVEGLYRAALARNPRYYPARYLYGRFVLDQGDVQRARGILEEGASYAYGGDEHIASYLLLTAALREHAGDNAGATALRERLAAYLAHPGDTVSFGSRMRLPLQVPEQARALLSAGAASGSRTK